MSDKPKVEEWWQQHAVLLSAKMKESGVSRFCIERTERGSYTFEVVPIPPAVDDRADERPFHPQRGDEFHSLRGAVCQVIEVSEGQVHVEHRLPTGNIERDVFPLEIYREAARKALRHGGRFYPVTVQTPGS